MLFFVDSCLMSRFDIFWKCGFSRLSFVTVENSGSFSVLSVVL